MGAACQKQFQNIPYQFEQSEQVRQRQRININSIKLEHKNLRPSTKNFSIGMIDSILESKNSVYNTKMNNTAYEQAWESASPSKHQMMNKSMVTNLKNATIANKQLDQQQLHATHRPFQSRQTVTLDTVQAPLPKSNTSIRELLDLNFYHSLALPQYSYRPYPPQYRNQYQNLTVCEQQIRNGVKYIGQWKDYKYIHGNGVMQSNTTKYIGQFRNGLKHFHGREIEKYQVYQGEFENGRRKGNGVLYTPDSVQQGIFDQYLVKGKIKYNNGNIYEGELKNNRYHGQGTYINKVKNIVQTGNFANGKMQGKGKIISNGRTVYDGQFDKDSKHGQGFYSWNDKQYYQGTYLRDKKHGRGIMVKGNQKYIGNFVNGQLNGPVDVFQIVDGREIRKGTHNYANGVKTYNDQQSVYSQQNNGMPADWMNIVRRNKQEQSMERYEESSMNSKMNEFQFFSGMSPSQKMTSQKSDSNLKSGILSDVSKISPTKQFPALRNSPIIEQQREQRLKMTDSKIMNNSQNGLYRGQTFQSILSPKEDSRFVGQKTPTPTNQNPFRSKSDIKRPSEIGSPKKNYGGIEIESGQSFILKNSDEDYRPQNKQQYQYRANQIKLGLQ